MEYSEWYHYNYSHLYEIYHYIILPARKVVKHESKLTFEHFCYTSYMKHGIRNV